MAIVSKKCNRCRRPLRNDGTEQNPKWVCNNKKCVKYVPPQPKPEAPSTGSPVQSESKAAEPTP
jgi:hypothetical protein